MIDRELDIQTADGAVLTDTGEGMYQMAGAERHWERLSALFGRNL